MKNFLKSVIFALTAVQYLTAAGQAQTIPGTASDGKAISGETQTPAMGLAKFLAERIHSVEVSRVISQMDQAGLKSS